MNDLVVGLGQPFPQLIQSNAQDTYSTDGQESEMSKNPSHHQYITAAVGFFAYAQLFLITRHLVGPEAAIISALPVVLLGWGLGMKGGFLGGLTIVTVNTVLLNFTGAGREFLWDSAYMEGSVVLLVVGAAVGRLKEVRDLMISNRMSLEEEVAEARDIAIELNIHKASFNSLVEKNSTGILIVDQDGTVRFANHAASSQLRRDPHNLIGQPLGIPLFAGDVIEIEITRKNEEPGMAEMRMDETQWEGQTAYLLSLGDITDRKQAELASHAKSEFLANMSHELRTPLTIIRGEAQVALRHADRDLRDYQDALTCIHEQAISLSHLVDDLLFVARTDSGTMRIDKRNVDLTALADEVIRDMRSLADKNDVSLEASYPVPVFAVIDPDRIKQLFIILVENALSYAGEGSSVKVSVMKQQDKAVVRVTDDGVGMDTEVALGPDGFGLSAMQDRVAAFGGQLMIQSKLGEGSEIKMLLVGNN